MSLFSKSIEMPDQSRQVFVAHVWFEAQFMLESDRKGQNEVQCGSDNVSVKIRRLPWASHTAFPKDPLFPLHLRVRRHRSILFVQGFELSGSEETNTCAHRPIARKP